MKIPPPKALVPQLRMLQSARPKLHGKRPRMRPKVLVVRDTPKGMIPHPVLPEAEIVKQMSMQLQVM